MMPEIALFCVRKYSGPKTDAWLSSTELLLIFTFDIDMRKIISIRNSCCSFDNLMVFV